MEHYAVASAFAGILKTLTGILEVKSLIEKYIDTRKEQNLSLWMISDDVLLLDEVSGKETVLSTEAATPLLHEYYVDTTPSTSLMQFSKVVIASSEYASSQHHVTGTHALINHTSSEGSLP